MDIKTHIRNNLTMTCKTCIHFKRLYHTPNIGICDEEAKEFMNETWIRIKTSLNVCSKFNDMEKLIANIGKLRYTLDVPTGTVEVFDTETIKSKEHKNGPNFTSEDFVKYIEILRGYETENRRDI